MYIGLDFGTSYSVVATVDNGQPIVLLPLNSYGVPSVFYHSKDDEDSVGADALGDGEGINSKNLVTDVKMKLLNSNFLLDGKSFSPGEIVQKICEYTISEAMEVADERAINKDIEGVVAAIPNKFGVEERNVIYNAVQKGVGIDVPVLDIIREPAAAAIHYYNLNCEDGKYILVYDLGGGTCDISILRSDSKKTEHYSVIASDMIRLGGRDWDERLLNYIKDELIKSGIVVREADEEAIRRAAVDGKHRLSKESASEVKVRVTVNGKVERVIITRKMFDLITADLLKQTIDMTVSLYNKNPELKGKLSEIICVGGSSNMLQVVEGLKKAFPEIKVMKSYPEHAVVRGLAIYSNKLSEICKNGVNLVEEDPGIIEDKVNFSYGTYYRDTEKGSKVKKNFLFNFIVKGSKLPAEGNGAFMPVEDNMEYIDCDLYESESDKKTDNADIGETYVGIIRLPLKPGTKSSEKITMNVKVNHFGLIEVIAHDEHGDSMKAEFVFNNSKWVKK